MSLEALLPAIDAALRDGKLNAEAHRYLKKWATGAAYAGFHAEIARLSEAGSWNELAESFGEVLPFGTGGRRGPMGVGPNRINTRTIGESAQGLATYLLKSLAETGGAAADKRPSVVIAFDTRNGSLEFARQVAGIFAGNGIAARLFDGPRSTPELSFAVRHLSADAGVVISASHNPPGDNGFKAYWSDGGQVVPPHDRRIIDEVVRVEAFHEKPAAAARAEGLLGDVGAAVDEAYASYTAGLAPGRERDLSIVFTPLHGTGTTSVWPSLLRAGFEKLRAVEEQWAPDGDFPGVPGRSPNPENPAALEAGTALARRHGADLVLASDPDADRLGVVVFHGGEPVFLNGNQIGILLLEHVVESLAARGGIPSGAVVYKTLVTTDLIDRICGRRNIALDGDLLVGFKYIAEKIRALPDPDLFLFGTEESHGYLRGAAVRDKDAAQAAVILCDRAAAAKARGRTLVDDLDVIYRREGYYRELSKGMVFGGPDGGGRGIETMRALMASLRKDPPRAIGSEAVVSVVDRENASIRDPRTGEQTGTVEGAQGNVLVFRLASTPDRVTIRPSGTEPKVKIYVQVHAAPEGAPGGMPLETARRVVDARAAGLAAALESLARERTARL